MAGTGAGVAGADGAWVVAWLLGDAVFDVAGAAAWVTDATALDAGEATLATVAWTPAAPVREGPSARA